MRRCNGRVREGWVAGNAGRNGPARNGGIQPPGIHSVVYCSKLRVHSSWCSPVCTNFSAATCHARPPWFLLVHAMHACQASNAMHAAARHQHVEHGSNPLSQCQLCRRRYSAAPAPIQRLASRPRTFRSDLPCPHPVSRPFLPATVQRWLAIRHRLSTTPGCLVDVGYDAWNLLLPFTLIFDVSLS